jgi:imidazolonepropionase-like amidohydrolase
MPDAIEMPARPPCLVLVLLVLLAPAALRADTLLRGPTLFDGNGGPPIERAALRIVDGRIACVGAAADCPPEDGDRVLELDGGFVTPGLVDAHVHFSQTGWLDGRPHWSFIQRFYDYEDLQRRLREYPDRWHRAYLCSGITAVFDVGGFPWTVGYQQSAEGRLDRAHVAAAGPLITHAEVDDLRALGADTFLPMGSDAEALDSVSRLAELGASAVKVWFLDPPDGQRDVLERRLRRIGAAADERGLPLIVHATQLRNAKAALRAGADMLVHSVDDAPVDDEFLALARRNDVVYAPTLLVGLNWNRATASVGVGMAYPIDDPNGCVDAETRDRIADAPELQALAPPSWRDPATTFGDLEQAALDLATMRRNLRAVHAAGITIATGTDAGNPLTLHGPSIYAEMEAMQAAGIDPDDIIVMSTRNGARAMGRLADIGTLEVGKRADLVVLIENPAEAASAFRSVRYVMRGGRLHDVEDLAAE